MKTLLISLALFFSVAAFADIDGDPLYANTVGTNGASFYAWRPFYSSSTGPERWRKDYLWPLYTKKGFKDEQYARFLFFGYSMKFSPETERERHWLLPFYFQGISAEDEDYLAIFPLGGTIYEFLGRDKITFVLFPIWYTSDINDVHSWTVLWPLISSTQGEKVDRFRVLPFYSRNTLAGEYEKKYYGWPLLSTVKYTHERNPGGGFIFIPIYGQIKTEKADNYWLFPPFFRYMASEKQWIVYAPWPFIQLADGEIKKRIFWPFYGKKELGTLRKQYMFWPIFWNRVTTYAEHERRSKKVVPFFHYQADVVTKAVKEYEVGEARSKYWKLWPLMSWERNAEHSRFRALELWPLRNTAGIERNWAPWWTLYRRVNEGGEIGHHVLWGIYRQKRSPEQFEWSLLKGLVGYKNIENNRSYRFLFMWFGDEEKQP
ncbi:MAG: hypothetical protein V5783_04040 [Pontiella sp.]